MSSDKTSENRKTQNLTRGKQSRRKMLKSMAAGSGAVIAGKSMPDQWAKPMVDSVLLPVHAQTSGPTSCTVSGSITAYHDLFEDTFADQTPAGGDDAVYGPFTIPDDESIFVSGDGVISLVPQITVTPGVTDNFTLNSTLSSGDVSNVLDLAQASVSPDPVNGTIPFNAIEVDANLFNITMTLTPDNSEFCGGPQVIDLTFFSD